MACLYNNEYPYNFPYFRPDSIFIYKYMCYDRWVITDKVRQGITERGGDNYIEKMVSY